MSRSVAEFLDEFVLPLVRGGETHVGKPVGADEIRAFEDELPHVSDSVVAVDDARADVLADLAVRPPPLILDADELHLAAAVHNLLFLAHPRAGAVTMTSSAARRVLETSRRFAARPRTRDRRRVLARHGLLHNLFHLARTDVTVTWWTGSATFRGQPPPSRLTAWRSVRRVREERSVASFDDLLGTVEASPVIASLLRRSPLTQLLSSSVSMPPLHWEDAAFVLRDVEMARAVAYAAIRPSDPRQAVAAPARFAAAFDQMLERAPEQPDVRAVAAFLVHLNALLAFAESRDRDVTAKSPLLSAVLAPERAGQRPRGLAAFFALPSALARVDERLAEPPGIRADPALTDRWQQHREQVLAAVGEAVVETLAARLERHVHEPGGAAGPRRPC